MAFHYKLLIPPTSIAAVAAVAASALGTGHEPGGRPCMPAEPEGRDPPGWMGAGGTVPGDWAGGLGRGPGGWAGAGPLARTGSTAARASARAATPLRMSSSSGTAASLRALSRFISSNCAAPCPARGGIGGLKMAPLSVLSVSPALSWGVSCADRK